MNKLTVLFYLGTLKTTTTGGGFDTEMAKSLINKYLIPLKNFLLWFVPLAFIVSALIAGVKYFFADDREREQKPISKTIWKLGISAIIIWSVPVIATILGLF